jgi:hypothetical protein
MGQCRHGAGEIVGWCSSKRRFSVLNKQGRAASVAVARKRLIGSYQKFIDKDVDEGEAG